VSRDVEFDEDEPLKPTDSDISTSIMQRSDQNTVPLTILDSDNDISDSDNSDSNGSDKSDSKRNAATGPTIYEEIVVQPEPR
jgi:hypothetical protein